MYFIRPVGQGYRIGEVVGKSETRMGHQKWLTIDHLDNFFGSQKEAEEYLIKKYGAEKNVTKKIVLQENYCDVRP
jgi:hypothetical protein